MRVLLALLLVLPQSPLASQAPPPRFMYIYRDSLKSGVDSAYRVIEEDAAQVCADLVCPNPYFALESLSGPHEVWWINTFVSDADTARVVKAYAANTALTNALSAVPARKQALIGKPVEGMAGYRADLTRGATWSIEGARFMVVNVGRNLTSTAGTMWQMRDSTLYAFQPARTREQAERLAQTQGGRVFAVRPNLSMPAPAWRSADPDFWRLAPSPRRERPRP